MKLMTPYDDGVRKFLEVLYDITFFVLELWAIVKHTFPKSKTFIAWIGEWEDGSQGINQWEKSEFFDQGDWPCLQITE
jgi:hypothetical protein